VEPQQRIKEEVKIPSLMLITGGIVSFLLNSLGLLSCFSRIFFDIQQREFIGANERRIAGFILEAIWYFPWLMLSIVVASGGIAMMKVRFRWFIIATIFIGFFPLVTNIFGCIVTIPAGIWALVVLFRPHIKEAFQ
jgi:hypothetical protein